ncbi:winged helix-turn-helix transcriptional regulator [Pseudomaricurvus alkylphenolicus]|uniref:MarR family winged helix-turn-helix transcriptional regulator n=1 Tax=Pseudomaricurvus alkylphenolicus TaxID=1306991 RepID=UPI0014232C07|nr:MarR family winged helix-turn-helix transcriptional regulator [Pseudomaricurvus alkylphenolicus]NIB40316.1 winged helix-turn-helix transcriptional regulator [Pseudomaricurvus alkylphenolicus]
MKLNKTGHMAKVDKPADPLCFDQYDDFLGFVVSQSGYLLGKSLGDAISKAGYKITPREFAVLNRVFQYKELSQFQIADLTFKDRPATTRMLDKLENLGYIKRRVSREDGRRLNVTLTNKGKTVRNDVVPLAVEMIKSGCEGISDEDIYATVKTLQTINSRLANA